MWLQNHPWRFKWLHGRHWGWDQNYGEGPGPVPLSWQMPALQGPHPSTGTRADVWFLRQRICTEGGRGLL